MQILLRALECNYICSEHKIFVVHWKDIEREK